MGRLSGPGTHRRACERWYGHCRDRRRVRQVSGCSSSSSSTLSVMAGHSSLPCADYVHLSALPAIHVFLLSTSQDVDARDKPRHDDYGQSSPSISRSSSAELRDFPWASSASERVTPPPSAPVITKFSAAMLGSS